MGLLCDWFDVALAECVEVPIIAEIRKRSKHGLQYLTTVECSDCQGFWNPHGLRVGYRRVLVRVQIPVPASYKTSPRTSKTDKNWWRYGPNSRKYCLAHISVISGPFWLFLGSKTRRVSGPECFYTIPDGLKPGTFNISLAWFEQGHEVISALGKWSSVLTCAID